MPLLSGKENIGNNISEMEKSGHPHAQAVAAALHTAYDEHKARTNERHDHEKNKYGR
jgi:hypothetical protein